MPENLMKNEPNWGLPSTMSLFKMLVLTLAMTIGLSPCALHSQTNTPPDTQLTNRFYSASGAWVSTSNTNGLVWNSFPNKGESVTWSGGVMNGKACGTGVEQWFVDNKPTMTYEGGMSNGLFDGHGIVKKSGYSHEGEWSKGDLVSKTVLITYNKDGWYKGEQTNGFKEGFGEEQMQGGSKYVGQFKRDRFHGHGELIFPNGDKVVGEWKNSRLDGVGKYQPTNGEPFYVRMTQDKIFKVPAPK
jgi:hypothetical protein